MTSVDRSARRARRNTWLVEGLAVGLALALPAAPAQACGGLFCSAATPVNQAAERIIFSYNKPEKIVTAVVEILYQGPSEKFAWVLPVPGIPEVAVSTSALLDRLQSITNPTYTIQRSWGGQCGTGRGPTGNSSGSGGSGGFGGGPAPSTPGGGPVAVLAAGTVGPYDYEVIKVDPAHPDPAMAAIMWLSANAYDVGMLGADVLRPYLREGLNLLAFKLTKNKTAGSIRPVMLTYSSDHPMIPIRPTAVAANDDMGILVWVLGSSRAVPTNYKTLELNEAMLDWFNPAMSYNDVIKAAADEAGGQGFVTEQAAPTTGIADQLFQERGTIDQFRRTADDLAPPQLIVQFIEAFATFSQGGGGFMGPFGGGPTAGMRVSLDGVTDVLAANLVLPMGVTIDTFMQSPRCYFAAFRMPGAFYCDGKPTPPTPIDLATFDRTKFLTAVEKLVIQPLEATTDLFRTQRYMTRFYTTMSAREMTLDPDFDLNTTLPDVSNQHTLQMMYLDSCPGDITGRWKATLASGQTVDGRDSTWPFDVKMQNQPINRRVMQLTASGPGAVVTDNSAKIGATATAPGGSMGTGGMGGSAAVPGSGSGGCTVGGSGTAASAGLLIGIAAIALVIRRRQRRG